MRYRWDPVYPTGRRDWQPPDADLRASDDERNGVADTLARHYAEGRLDEAEFKKRLDAAMSARTRGDLDGLFFDLPHLPSEPPPPPSRRQRIGPWLVLFAFLVLVAGSTVPFSFSPLYHVPWFLIAVVGFVLWRRAAGRASWQRHHQAADPARS